MNLPRQIGLILLGATVAGTASAFLHPLRPPWFETEDPETLRWRLPVAEAKALKSAGPVVWIDSRKREAYEKGHLPGALLLNAEEWGELMFEHQVALQEAFERPVVVYCDGAGCERSDEIARQLRELLGLEPVYVLEGSWRELLDP